MRLAPWCPGLLFFAVGCARPAPAPVDVPPEVSYAAILALDASGALVDASPIFAWSQGQALPVFGSAADRLVVVAWSERQLGALGVLGAPLEAHDGQCVPRLPAPAWAGELADGAVAAIDRARLPVLRSPALSRCDGEVQPVLGLGVCSLCVPEIQDLGACRFRYDYSACAFGQVDVLALADGGVCLLPPQLEGDWRCVERTPEEGVAVAEATCETPRGRCELSLYSFPKASPFTMESVRFRDAPLFTPDLLQRTGHYGPHNLTGGWAYDFALVGGELEISTSGTTAVDRCFDAQPGPGELLRLSLSDLQVVGTATTPSCLASLRNDARGPGLVGVYADAAGLFRLGRFDPDGRMIQSVPITPTDGGELTVRGAQPLSIEVAGPFYFTYFGGGWGQDRVHAFQQNSLEAFSDRGWSGLDLTIARRGNAMTTVLGTAGAAHLYWLELDDLSFSHEERVPTDPGNEHSDGIYAMLIEEERIYVGAGPPDALYVLDRAGVARSRQDVLGAGGLPVLILPWPADPRRLLVVSTRPSTEARRVESWASFFDREAERFLPGEWRLGDGVATQYKVDAEQRVYLLLPWAATVVRLTPAP